MRIEDGGGGSRKPPDLRRVATPAPKPTAVRSPGSKFALKNDGGVKRPVPATPQADGARVASAYRPGTKFALKNDGGTRGASPSTARGTTARGPGSQFALKNDGPTGSGTGAPSRLTDREALSVAGSVHDAMFGELVGTRESQAFAALRGLSAADVRQVAYEYEIKYGTLDPERTSPEAFRVEGSLLYSRLQGELEANGEIGATGHDWAQAQALLRGDSAGADAIALQSALERPWLLPGGRADEILSILRRAEPAERQALIEAFAKDFAERDHTVVHGMGGAAQVPGTEMAQYDKDPATLVMNVLKTHLGGGNWTEAVGLITAAKYVSQPAVAEHAQGEATVGRLYGLLDRPFPDRASALAVLEGLGPEERAFVQGLATGQAEPTKLEKLLRDKLTDSEFQQASAYLSGDANSARATALHAALTRTSPAHGYQVPAPDVAAAEQILGELASDDERRALLAAFERQYHQDAASLIPAVVGDARREVLVAQLRTSPTVLEAGASSLAGLGGEAVEAGIEYRADVVRLAIQSRLVGVAEDDVRRAFAGLDASQARALAALPLRPGEPAGRTLGDELGQWYRGGGGGRFTLELQQMLDGDGAATQDRQQLIDEAQAQYTLETTGPLVGANDAVQRLFGNDARAVLDADAARLRAAEAALRASSLSDETARTDMAVAYMGTGLGDYRTAKEATTEAAKTVATTVAVVGTTVATAGTAAAVWAPVMAGAAANVAASQFNGASNSWQDDAIAVAEGAASGLTLPGSAVSVRGGQYLVREAAEQGGQQVFRSVSRTLAQEAVEKSLAEGAQEVLARGGQVILRDAGRELTVQAFRPTLARAIGQNVAEGVTGSIVGDLSAGALKGELNAQQLATNAVLAAGTAGLLGLGLAGASRLTEHLRGASAEGSPVPDPLPGRELLTREERGTIGRAAQFGDEAAQKILLEDYIARHPQIDAETAALLRNPPPPELSGLSGHDAVLASMVTGNTSLGRWWFAHTRGVMKDTVSPLTQVAMKVHAAGGAREEVGRILELGMRLAQPTEGRAGVRYMRSQYLADLQQAAKLISTHLPDQDELLRRIDSVLDEGKPPSRTPAADHVAAAAPGAAVPATPTPPTEAADVTMQAAFVEAMRQTGVAELAVRSSNPEARVWYGIGGGTLRDAQGRVVNPPAQPVRIPLVDGRPQFPIEPRASTGAIFPSKPGGPGDSAVNLGPAEVVSLNEARAAAGLTPLQEAFPDLPIPRLVTIRPDGQEVWVRQQMLGGARVVVANPVRDAQGRVIDGDLVVAVSDVDLAYAVHADGHLLSDAEINAPGGLREAINAAYGAALGVDYEIVNHGAHLNGLRDPRLVELYDLDAPRYWSGPVHTFAAGANGYTGTASLGDTYRRLVDPHYVPRWQRGGTVHRR